jgi:hypothetical protein
MAEESSIDVDVVVVGAGLWPARRPRARRMRGRRVIVLEARESAAVLACFEHLFGSPAAEPLDYAEGRRKGRGGGRRSPAGAVGALGPGLLGEG